MAGRLWIAILPLAVAETLLWAALYYAFPALLPVWEEDLGWSRDEISGAFTASLVVMAVMAPRAGRIIDRGKSGTMFLWAIAAGAALLVLLGLVREVWQFWAVWIAIGAVNACILYEACFAIITVTLGSRARAGITIVTLVAGFAGTVCFPSYYLLNELLGWRGAVFVFAGITLFVSLPLAAGGLRLIERHRAPAAETPPAVGSEARAVLREPAFWWIGLAFGTVGLTHGMMISQIRPILGEAGLAVTTAVLVASCFGPMQVLGRIAIVAIGDRISTFATGTGAFFCMAIGLMALISAGAAPFLAIAFVVPYAAAWGVFSIVRPVLTADFLGRAGFGAISGMVAVPFTLGSAGGPFLAARIWESAGSYAPVLWLGFGLVLMGWVLILAARKSARPKDV